MQEFKINDYISLKLESKKTVIYVAGEPFKQCKFLLLNIPIDEIKSFDEIESIDEAAEKLDRSMESKREQIKIPPETEFWGHCSNLQVWVENDYNTRLLYSNLAFPLLKKLTEAGDPAAKRVFKEEIAKRFASGYIPVITYLAKKGYLNYLNKEEISTLFKECNFTSEIILKIFESSPESARLIFILTEKNPFQYIQEIIEYIPKKNRAMALYNVGYNIANVKITPTDFETNAIVQKSKESNVELGIQILELAVDFHNCPDKVYDVLPHLYGSKNRWDKTITVYEKAIERNGIKPMYITGIFMAAFLTGRHDIVDKYLDLSLNSEEVLAYPYSLSNVVYALNRKETKEASEIALKLTKDYWKAVKSEMPSQDLPSSEKRSHTMIPSLWVNMTDTYIVADKMDETFEDIINHALNKLEEMHPVFCENLAWYFLKNERINEAIYYLKEAKKKGHPGFIAIKDSKYFQSLRENPDFLGLFEN